MKSCRWGTFCSWPSSLGWDLMGLVAVLSLCDYGQAVQPASTSCCQDLISCCNWFNKSIVATSYQWLLVRDMRNESRDPWEISSTNMYACKECVYHKALSKGFQASSMLLPHGLRSRPLLPPWPRQDMSNTHWLLQKSVTHILHARKPGHCLS